MRTVERGERKGNLEYAFWANLANHRIQLFARDKDGKFRVKS